MGDIFIVAVFITVGVILWMAALPLVNVQQVSGWPSAHSDTVEEITGGAQRIYIKPGEKVEI